MDKTDCNGNFKTKVSRSLTDLQNSLDEACRLGLPPNLGDLLHDTNDAYYGGRKHGASSNLERFIASHEDQFERFGGYDRDRGALGRQRNNSNDNNEHANRQVYLDTLRILAAADRSSIPRSQSYEAINSRPKFAGTHGIDTQKNHSQANRIRNDEALESEIRLLRRKLVEMDEEMMLMRNGIYRDMGCVPSGEFRSTMGSDSAQETLEELRRKLEIFKSREAELLNQLNEAICTIEEAKLEEMQAVMRAEQLAEELENMKVRFKDMVEENQKKLENQSQLSDKYVQDTIRQLDEDLRVLKGELERKNTLLLTSEEQLKSSKLEIERISGALAAMQFDSSRLTDDLTTSTTRVVLQRDEAVAHANRLQGLLDRDRASHCQAQSIMQEEIDMLRTRLSASENAQLNISQDKANLVNENSRIKTEMMRAEQSRQSEMRRAKDECESVIREKDGRIANLGTELSKKQSFFETMIAEAETMIRRQAALLNKVKHEFGANVNDLDGFVERHRDEVGYLQNKLEHSTEELHAVKEENRELQHTLDEYCSTMESMRARFREGEMRKDHQDSEIIALLSRQNELMSTTEGLIMQLQEVRRRSHDCRCGALDPDDVPITMPILSGGTISLEMPLND